MGRNRAGVCSLCASERKSLHRDHITPKWKGGVDTDNNIQWICANCHEDKSREDLKGRKSSPDEIERNRQQGIKQFQDPQARLDISDHAKKYWSKFSLEERRKRLGRTTTPEARAKLSASMKKHFENPEAIEKIRQAALRRHERERNARVES